MARVLHLIPGLTGGGAERQLTLLAAAQATLGHEVHIGVLRPDVPPTLKNCDQVSIHLLSARANHDPMLFFRIRQLVQQLNVDVVQTWLAIMDVLGGGAALSTNTPWILSERSQAEAYPASWKNLARTRLARSANAVVANSKGGVDYWTLQGVAAERIEHIPNAVDVTAIASALSAQLPANFQHRSLVLFVGRLSEEKMPFVVIEALANALSGTNAVALLCGTGPLEKDMRTAIEAARASDRITLGGHRDDVFALMRVASVCVAISRFEGNPNVVLEAMAAGCPLIVSDIAAYRQLLDKECAIFVPVNDANATAHAIKLTLADPESAHQRALCAQSRVVGLSPVEIAAQIDAVYARTLRKPL